MQMQKITEFVEKVEEHGITSIAKVGTWVAPIVVAWMAINAMQDYLNFSLVQALFTAGVLEIVGLGVVVNQQQAAEYVAYYDKISPEEREKHNLIEVHMWQYNIMVVLYTVTLLIVIVGLKIAPDNPFLLNAAVAALAVISFVSTTSYMMRRSTTKRWQAVQSLVKVSEEIELLQRDHMIERMRASAVADNELRKLDHAIELAEKQVQAAQRMQELRTMQKEHGVDISATLPGLPTPTTNGHVNGVNGRAKPKAKPAAKADKPDDKMPKDERRALLLRMVDGARVRSDVNLTDCAVALDTTRQTVMRDIEYLVKSEALPPELSKDWKDGQA